MFKFTKSLKTISGYAYLNCDGALRTKLNYSEYKEHSKDTLTIEEFSKCIRFMILDGYFDDRESPFTKDHELYILTILPRLIREYEAEMC